MIDTASERIKLAMMVRELERKLNENRDTVFKPLIPHLDHVRHYFDAYKDCLNRALSFPGLPQRSALGKARDSPLPVHRDNLGSLAGRIGELASALEASTVDIERDLATLKVEVSRLEGELQQSIVKNAKHLAEIDKLKLKSDTGEKKHRALQAWAIAAGVLGAATFGLFDPGLTWLAALIAGLNTSLVAILFRT